MPDASALPLLSLTTALGAGLLIGLPYERRKRDDPAIAAGLRTHTLLALAGAVSLWIGVPAFIATLLLGGSFAALSYLRGQRTPETASLLRDYIRWEPRNDLKRRARRLLDRVERQLA